MPRQLIQATDWYALYLLPDEPYHRLKRLVGWQLEQYDSGGSDVVGLIIDDIGTTVEPANKFVNFARYLHADQLNDGSARQIIAEHRTNLARQSADV